MYFGYVFKGTGEVVGAIRIKGLVWKKSIDLIPCLLFEITNGHCTRMASSMM